MTKIVTKKQIGEIITCLKNHQVVAFPTETVFGLGVLFNDRIALDKLMEAKNRDYSKAITLMVSSIDQIEEYAYVDEKAQKLMKAFMPGMMTLVLRKKECVDPYMTNNKDTIGIRIPDDEFVLSLLKQAGPMLVTSANLSNHPNTTNTKEVLSQLDGRIELIVDGQTKDNIASSVVSVIDEVKILREGKINQKKIEEALK